MKAIRSQWRRAVLILIVLTASAVGTAHLPASYAAEPPAIEAPLVREGTYAVRLAYALRVATTDDEIEAVSKLAGTGISPRNGWIIDYPVTPDIITELQAAVGEAASAGRLVMGKEEALMHMADVNSELGLSISPAGEGYPAGAVQSPPDSTVINNYYYSTGPPIVTYYAPPPSYVYLYAWVASPFWYAGFWFPGFYILNDFHRTVVIRGRPLYISNHYRDMKLRRYYRIDPGRRYVDPHRSRFESPRYRDDIRLRRAPGRDRGVIEKLDERMREMRRQNQPPHTPVPSQVKPSPPQTVPKHTAPAARNIGRHDAPARGGAVPELSGRMGPGRPAADRPSARNPGGHGRGRDGGGLRHRR